jgi:hypothetical protein
MSVERAAMNAIQIEAFGNAAAVVKAVDIPDVGAPSPSEMMIAVEVSPVNISTRPRGSGRLSFYLRCSHIVKNRPAFLSNIIPALKPGGKVVTIDFYRRELPVGPPLWAKLSEEKVKEDFLKVAFKLDKQLTFLPYQYFLIFTK